MQRVRTMAGIRTREGVITCYRVWGNRAGCGYVRRAGGM